MEDLQGPLEWPKTSEDLSRMLSVGRGWGALRPATSDEKALGTEGLAMEVPGLS